MKMMMKRTIGVRGAPGVVVAVVCMCLCATMTEAQSAEEFIDSGRVQIRARVEPQRVFVGQKAELIVDVLTSTWFLRAPQYPASLDIDRAITPSPEAFGINFTDTIGGESFAGQTRKFPIFPQVSGRLVVPSFKVTLVVADDNAKPSPEIALHTPSLELSVDVPPGTEHLGVVPATPRLTVTESYSRPLDDLEVGDAFDRTITMTIQGSVAMLLPPISFTAGGAVAVYPARPELEDRRNRGLFTGSRTDSASFVLESEGSATLPAIEIHWWDLGANRLRTETLPAVEFDIAANPELAPEHLGIPEEDATEQAPEPSVTEPPWWRLPLIALAVIVVVLALRRPLGALLHQIENTRHDGRAAETEAFKRFTSTARSGDPSATYSSLMAWLDRALPAEGPVTLREVAGRYGDTELDQQLEALEDSVYAPAGAAGTWSPKHLVAVVSRLRDTLLDGAPGNAQAPPLPPLNPKRASSSRPESEKGRG
jgi:hypothetical protein